MADASITIQLEGSEANGGDLQLSEFINELSAIKNALRLTEKTVLDRAEHSVVYRVTNLSHSSPARVTISVSSKEPIYRDVPRRITRRFTTALSAVRRNHRYAERLDIKTLEAFKAIASPATKHDLKVLVLSEGSRPISIDRDFDRKISRLIAATEEERDQLFGRIERVDIHNKNVFDIYPTVGPDRVRCTASLRLLGQVLSAVGKKVAVDGWALYRKGEPFPHGMRVENIEIYPSDEELPKLQQLHGIALDATDGRSSEEFVRELRDARW
jgi:hypothetical protein